MENTYKFNFNADPDGDQQQRQQPIVINNEFEFTEACEDYFDGDYYGEKLAPWCYLFPVSALFNIPAGMRPCDFLQGMVQWIVEGPRLVQLSVTSRENNHQDWLDAVSGIPGHTITTLVRNANTQSAYTVYLCTFPSHPEL